jgi:gamma-glutamyltranspeptidase/glutathione hydrolase
VVSLEDGIPEEVLQALVAMGHKAELVTGHNRGVFGRGQIIRRLPNGVLWAGSDGRADGMAMGW